MAEWWEGAPGERYWCEITDREVIGEDLWCPQLDESEKPKPYWSYSMINEVAQGDIVFHYYTPDRAYLGASVACGVVEDTEIVHAPHGTVGRTKEEDPKPRAVGVSPSLAIALHRSRFLLLGSMFRMSGGGWRIGSTRPYKEPVPPRSLSNSIPASCEALRAT